MKILRDVHNGYTDDEQTERDIKVRALTRTRIKACIGTTYTGEE